MRMGRLGTDVNSPPNVSNSILAELYHHISSRRAEELTLECYEELADETKYYRGQVTSNPGCPSFLLLQWTLLLEGRAPDLEKVLSGHYPTTIDPKQS
jgi:hypothetical protein